LFAQVTPDGKSRFRRTATFEEENMRTKKINRLISTIMTTLLLLGMLPVSTFSSTPVKGTDVTKVTFGNNNAAQGILVQVGSKKWNHYYPDGKRLLTSHTETGRDEWSVYLANGNIIIAVNLWKKTVTYSKGASYSGKIISSSNAANPTASTAPAPAQPVQPEVTTPTLSADEAEDARGPAPLTPNEMAKVMEWIALKVSAIRVPYCYRRSETRGAGQPLSNQCAAGLEKNGALCYPRCRAGFKGAGPVCWQGCAPGFRDIGAFCQKPAAYGRGGGYPWRGGDRAFSLDGARKRCAAKNPQGCEKYGAIIYPKCKAGFKNAGSNICSPICPAGQADTGTGCRKQSYGRTAGQPLACRPGMQQGRKTERSGLLCYPTCKNRDYVGVGPVCWQQCPSQQPVGCGFGCSLDKGTCASVISDQVLSPIMAVVSLATLGSTAAANAAAKTAKQGLGGAAAVAKAAKGTSKISQTALRAKKLIKSAKAWSTIAVGGQRNMDKLIKTGKMIKIGKKYLKATGLVKKEIDLFRTEFSKDFVKQTSPEIDAEIRRRFDPRGAEYVRQEWAINHLSLMFEADAWATSKTVISMASIADPTGISSVINAYMHPICKASAVFPNVRIIRTNTTPTTSTPTTSTPVTASASGKTWKQIGGSLKHVSVGSDGATWGVNSGDNIYRWAGTRWINVPGKLKQISVGNASQVWGVNAADNIYQWTGRTWRNIPGKLKHVSVGSDGTVWGVNKADQIYRRNGNTWTNVPGRLKQISVGSASHVWGVNKADQIYQWTGSTWKNIPGRLKYVSVGSDGTVWGVNAGNVIYRRNGSTWTSVAGNLKQISAGASNQVWGVYIRNGAIYTRTF
jgi:hypothetical protein